MTAMTSPSRAGLVGYAAIYGAHDVLSSERWSEGSGGRTPHLEVGESYEGAAQRWFGPGKISQGCRTGFAQELLRPSCNTCSRTLVCENVLRNDKTP